MKEDKHVEKLPNGREVHFSVFSSTSGPGCAIDRFCPYCGAEDAEELYRDEWPYYTKCSSCGLSEATDHAPDYEEFKWKKEEGSD